MGLENPEAFERNIEGHRPALEKFDPDIIKIMNDTLMMMPMDVSFVETAEDLKKIQPMSMDCEYVKKQIELTKRVVEIYKGHDAPLLVTSFSAAWLLRNAFTVDLPVAGADEHIMKKLMAEDPQAIADCLMTISKGIVELNKILLNAVLMVFTSAAPTRQVSSRVSSIRSMWLPARSMFWKKPRRSAI